VYIYLQVFKKLTDQVPPVSPSLLSSIRYSVRLRVDIFLAYNTQVDTIAKRLMSNQGKVVAQFLLSHRCFADRLQIASASQANTVIFKDYAHSAIARKFTSLFPGLGYAAGYKVSGIHK